MSLTKETGAKWKRDDDDDYDDSGSGGGEGPTLSSPVHTDRDICKPLHTRKQDSRENKSCDDDVLMMFVCVRVWCRYDGCCARGRWREREKKQLFRQMDNQVHEKQREGEISWEMFPPRHLFSRGRGPVCDPLASRYLPLFTLLGNETKRCDVRNNNGVTLYIYRGKKKRCGLLGHTERAILAAGKDTLLTRYGLESPLESHSQICKSYRGHPPFPSFWLVMRVLAETAPFFNRQRWIPKLRVSLRNKKKKWLYHIVK